MFEKKEMNKLAIVLPTPPNKSLPFFLFFCYLNFLISCFSFYLVPFSYGFHVSTYSLSGSSYILPQ